MTVSTTIQWGGHRDSPEFYQSWQAYKKSCVDKAFLQACAWFSAIRDAGVPLSGQWQWMTPDLYRDDQDAYVSFFVKMRCAKGCAFFEHYDPRVDTGMIAVCIDDISSRRYLIHRYADSYRQEYHISSTGPLLDDLYELRGTTPWHHTHDAIDLSDVQEITYRQISQYTCKHLRMLVEPDPDLAHLIESLIPLQLLENPAL